MKKQPTASEIGRKGGKNSWKLVSAAERSRIMRERALKAWRTKRQRAKKKVQNSP